MKVLSAVIVLVVVPCVLGMPEDKATRGIISDWVISPIGSGVKTVISTGAKVGNKLIDKTTGVELDKLKLAQAVAEAITNMGKLSAEATNAIGSQGLDTWKDWTTKGLELMKELTGMPGMDLSMKAVNKVDSTGKAALQNFEDWTKEGMKIVNDFAQNGLDLATLGIYEGGEFGKQGIDGTSNIMSQGVDAWIDYFKNVGL